MEKLVVLLMKALGTTSGSYSRTAEQDVRKIVQEEMMKSPHRAELLLDVMRLMEEKKKNEKQEKEETMIKNQLEELNHKLEKLDRNKKVQETREWMQDLLQKMAVADSGGSGQKGDDSSVRADIQKHSFNFRGPGRGNYHGKDGGGFARSGSFSRDNDSQKKLHDTAGPWHPKYGNYRGSSHGAIPKGHGRGNYHGSGRGGFPRSESCKRENDNQKNLKDNAGTWQPQRGNYRGCGHGAVPKSGRGGKFVPFEGNEDHMKPLNAKLQNLSVSDVQLTLSPEEIITIKNALKAMNSSEKQTKNRKKLEPKKKPTDEKKEKERGTEKSANQDDDPEKMPLNTVTQGKKPTATPQQQESTATPQQQGLTPTTQQQESTSIPKKEDQTRKQKELYPEPIELYELDSFNNSVFQFLSGDQELKDLIFMVREGVMFNTYQPRTVGELKQLASQYPSGQLYSTKLPVD